MPRRSEVRLRPSSASSEGENENVEISKQGEESANEKPNHERDLERGAKRKNGSPSIKCEAAEQSVTPIGKTLRLRDRIHLKYVSDQPCMACGRSPSDAHHLRFAQGRASPQIRARTRAGAQGERRIHGAALPYPPSRTAPASPFVLRC